MSIKSRHVDLTEGNLFKKIVVFYIPILLTSILQQGYNLIDSYVLGNYLGTKALGAVGCCSQLLMGLTNLFQGFSLAGTILVGRYLGSKENEKIKDVVSNITVMAIAYSFIVVSISYLATDSIMNWLNVPAEIYADAKIYFRIYVAGSTFNFVYYVFNSIFRAAGNSRLPLITLMATSVVNLLLDILFIKMGLAVAGVALATLLSMLLSTIIGYINIRDYGSGICLKLNELNVSFKQIKEIILIGLPGAMLNVGTSFSNVFGQTYLNVFGTEAIAGNNVANKINNFLMVIAGSFVTSSTTIASQNFGSKKYDRIKQGVKYQLIMGITLTILVSIPLYLKADFFISLFDQNPEVIRYGSECLRIIVLTTFLMNVSHIYNGTVRGMGNTLSPMLLSAVSMVLVRISFLEIGMRLYNSIYVVFYSSVAVNVAAALLTTIYFNTSKWVKTHLQEQAN